MKKLKNLEVKNYDKRLENLERRNNLAIRILVFRTWNSWSHSNWDIRRISSSYPHISRYPLSWNRPTLDITTKEKIKVAIET